MSLLRPFKPDDLGQRGELIVLLGDAAGEICRSAQRHDLAGVGKPLSDDRVMRGDVAEIGGDAFT